MSKSKVIWTGTYAGYAVDVRIAGGVPVQFLDGRRSMLPGDREGITNAAVVELAAERDALRERVAQFEAEQQRDALRERLAKLESEASANGEALRERLAKLNTMLENAEECPTRPFSGCICCKAFAQIKERVW